MLVIGNYRRKCDLASRACRGGDGDEQRQATMNPQQAAHLVDGLVWLRNACAYALGAVHG